MKGNARHGFVLMMGMPGMQAATQSHVIGKNTDGQLTLTVKPKDWETHQVVVTEFVKSDDMPIFSVTVMPVTGGSPARGYVNIAGLQRMYLVVETLLGYSEEIVASKKAISFTS